MGEEVYRSFEGKLDCDTQTGYIITEFSDFYEIEFLSVWSDVGDSRVRIRKGLLAKDDFANLDSDRIVEIIADIEFGRADYGQCFYKGKWYSYDTICRIQEVNKSYDWRKFVK